MLFSLFCAGFFIKGCFLTNYDVIRVERKTAEYAVISSFIKKPAKNREKSTNGDYYVSVLASEIISTLEDGVLSVSRIDCHSKEQVYKAVHGKLHIAVYQEFVTCKIV